MTNWFKSNNLGSCGICSHEFHKSCIDPWLIEHRTCPMCKLDVLKFYGYTVDGKVHLAAMETPITTPVPTPLQNLTPTEVSTSTTLSTFETIEAVAHVTAELQHANHTNPSITLTDDTVSILLFTDSSQASQDGIGALSPESHLTPQSDYNQILTHQQLLQYHQKMLQRFLFVTDYNKIGKLLNSRNYKTSTACQPLSGHQMQCTKIQLLCVLLSFICYALYYSTSHHKLNNVNSINANTIHCLLPSKANVKPNWATAVTQTSKLAHLQWM